MKSVFRFVFFGFALAAMAQQQVVPEEFNRQQKKIFIKVTQSVSTPCCRNGIPVAYHDSGMALYVRGLIKEALLKGADEEQIFAQMRDLRLGEAKEPLIFTIPEGNNLGRLAWASPFLLILFGAVAIYYLFVRGTKKEQSISDMELLETYRPYIAKQLAGLDS